MRDTPSSYPKPTDGKPYDSEAPTQLWQSPFRQLSQFPTRRAARRRERLEALLKGQDVTSTGLLSSTNITVTTATPDVSPLPLPENVLPEVPPPPDSIPTGTYTSIRPVSGPRMAVFIAVGVAIGGLAALQLNRVLTPKLSEKQALTTVSAPPTVITLAAAQPPVSPPLVNAFEPESCAPEAQRSELIPPLQVDVVAMRPAVKASKPYLQTMTQTETPTSPSTSANVASLVNPEQTNQASCSRYPAVHIPTQLHPRVNPLMTSNQVFAEQGPAKPNRQVPHR